MLRLCRAVGKPGRRSRPPRPGRGRRWRVLAVLPLRIIPHPYAYCVQLLLFYNKADALNVDKRA